SPAAGAARATPGGTQAMRRRPLRPGGGAGGGRAAGRGGGGPRRDRAGGAAGGRPPAMTVRGTKMESTTLAHLTADSASAEPAIIAEDAAVTISHRALADSIERLAGVLRCAGLRSGDAVALVLPNGPELLVLFLALARARLIAAPLTPAY